MDREAIVDWLKSLDGITYYETFGVGPRVTPDDLKLAFHAFADTFHPDAHAGRPENEREAIGRIFRHGNEAYRVLSDPVLRAQYDASLANGEPPSVASRRSVLPASGDRATGRHHLIDTIKSPLARPLVVRAEQLFKQGDLKQAKLQLTLALGHEPDNPALKGVLANIEARLKNPAK
jgi:curved DNA-binding protein CbpA